MKLLTEYLERAMQLDALAADESDLVFKGVSFLLKQAYRKLAAKRAKEACLRQVRQNQTKSHSGWSAAFCACTVNGNLIQNRPLYVAVPLNRLVDLVALLTHRAAFSGGRANRATCDFYYEINAVWFQRLRSFQIRAWTR
jgi:hypothetical protein